MSFRDALLPLLDRCFETGGILSYHAVVEEADVPSPAMHISASSLRRQLTFVRDRYDVLPLRELVDRHARRRSTDRCVAITFDDAYTGVAQLAAPLLRDLDLPATIFVTSAISARRGTYWWDELENARRDTSPERWRRTIGRLDLPSLPRTPESIALIRDRIIARHGGRIAGLDDTRLPELLRALDFPALRALAADSRFDFGCHTLSHPALPRLSLMEQEREIRDAQNHLRLELPRVVPIVAYPYGLYDDTTIQAARRAGMTAGATMQPRAVDLGDSAFTLPRIGVSEDWTVGAIGLRMSAGLRPLFIARMGGRHPRVPADPLLAAVSCAVNEP